MTSNGSGTSGSDAGTPEHAARRTWKVPVHIGRFRTSTIVLVLAFVATAFLRGYFISEDPQEAGGTSEPTPTTTSEEHTSEPTTRQSTATVTTTPTTSPGATSHTESGESETGTVETTTTVPLLVLPPGIVPSGVSLPPGVVVESTETPSEPSTTTP